MAWDPKAQVIDLVPVADNLLAYIEANQSAALEWANGGPGLKDFAKFYTNASGRLQTMFPSLMILAQKSQPELEGEVLRAEVDLTLEGTVGGGDPDQLVNDTKRYAKAVESMLMNLDSLTDGSNVTTSFHLLESETVVDILQGRSGANAFTQIFQIRVKYGLITAAYRS